MRSIGYVGISLFLLCTEAQANRPGALQPIAPLPLDVVAYEHVGFEGAALPIRGDIPDLRAPGFLFNDIISSIRLTRGVISVYEHVGYTGRCQTLRASNTDLRGSFVGNDTISSIRLGRECLPRRTARSQSEPVQGADSGLSSSGEDDLGLDQEPRCGFKRRR